MATLTIDVPDALAARVLAAIRATMPETATMTDGQAGKHFLRQHIRSALAAHEERLAADQVRAAVEQARAQAWADTEVIT